MENIIAIVRAHFARPANLAYLDRVLMRESLTRVISRLG